MSGVFRLEGDFKLIYERFCNRVYRIAFQMTKDAYLAEDITQETFIKAYTKLDTIVEMEKIGSWLSTTASRTAIDFIRKEKGMGALPIEENERMLFDLAAENKFNVEMKVEQNLLEEEIEQRIKYLKPSLKEVFLLKYKKGFNEKEIAGLLQLPKSTVKSRLHRARRQLRPEVEVVLQVS